MTLPKVYATESQNHSTLMRLIAEWTFSPSFRHSNFPLSEGHFFKPRTNNLMCISGAAGSGKTQLAARVAHWLSEMGCLGGYFTFDQPATSPTSPSSLSSGSSSSSSFSSLLDALPLTLIHQAATVEPGLAPFISDTFTKNTGAAQQPLEQRFETLFVLPTQAFVANRLPTGGAWNPLPPLVFIIDGLSESVAHPPGAVDAFAAWVAGRGVRWLPPHVRFLILTRPEVGLEGMLRERGAACVYEEMDVETPLTSHSDSEAERVDRGVTAALESGVPSPSFKGGH
ncbi:hypothetical protein BDN70DRAFT_695152 [Pholiota conissans]|uniref:Nephrocystin 3-like N-terminal domain-containing protein n=1 Tax=Pholiota conissans TaxID=109636 RepID=A0A9P6D0G9_9AGAR|nr:hypothetical protein BDN70DRAFT_695152 [Pholiota conissans]